MEHTKSFLYPILLALSLVLPTAAAGAMGEYGQHYRREPMASHLLMLIPDEFDRYTYREGPTFMDLGRRAEGLLDISLRSEFGSFGMDYTRSASAALARLSRRDADLAAYDLVGIPRFDKVRYWNRGLDYGFDIDLIVDFYRTDGTQVTSIRGHGETRTGAFSGASPGDSGDRALRMAVSAVRDGVIKWNEHAN